MSINSRNKGAAFERQIANALINDLNLKNPVKRILEQTRTKELPDLMLGRWCIECKAYGAPYALHSIHHLPSIRSGNSLVRVCSKILLTGFFKLRSFINALAICRSNAAPLFLELIDKIYSFISKFSGNSALV